ncbi:hypothetical protein I5V32_19540 [Stenotrophomonas maltophilia]|uniref:Uncharacterized protein n=1 Tax=Stenotrophomonas maltophilia TaxID=40324 RepID=A0AA40YDN6_STEMA|nr:MULTISPECIES: hypothetical protein [Stenotrophomonas]AWB80191.1 hypothetical protein B7H26_20655 [Stenotrophomonas maltophilia]KOO85896.1 hypothetical protein VL21_06130 [Stenotrophomonas maltophilia]KUO98083.1 hypothetical protein AR276_17840 [Stenotrophomonas maltophilia]MBH1584624.1 hypothetical protein [Stenotrophomonas maltophilia]MBH1718323.1 hypothetical protein [Stenotrophomonas maltophilia]
MARVLVVGTDIQGEQALLQRLRLASALPDGQVRRSQDLDDCDLLVIRDTPALRNAAQRMRQQRPRLQCWIEDIGGQLRDGDGHQDVLDDGAIGRALRRMQLAPEPLVMQTPAPIRLADGAHAITRLLRERLPLRQGQALLGDAGEPLLLMDLEHDQAVLLQEPAAALVERLADAFEGLQLDALTPARLQALAGERPRQPLRPLLWQWAQRSRHWQALDERLRGASVKLLRWPDFRVLGHDHDGFRLCSLLLKRACTVEECAMLLELPAAAVRDFIHAAYLCGYAQLQAAPATLMMAAGGTRTDNGLLARLWRHLRGSERNA